MSNDIKYATTTGQPARYEEPDELTQHEIAEALTIMRAIKRHQRGWMIVSPAPTGKGRGLFITGPLEKLRAA